MKVLLRIESHLLKLDGFREAGGEAPDHLTRCFALPLNPTEGKAPRTPKGSRYRVRYECVPFHFVLGTDHCTTSTSERSFSVR